MFVSSMYFMENKTNMELNQYQELTKTTRLTTADPGYIVLGLVGEVGELYGYLAKSIRDGFEPDQEKLMAEMGDILWFYTEMCSDMGFSLEDIASYNLTKLAKRQAEDKIKGSGDNR